MTTQTTDRVIEALTQYLEVHPDSDTVKFMLYANPNGSGLTGPDSKMLQLLQERIYEMRNTGNLNLEGLELPLKSLGLEARIRHTIDELIARLEIANLIRAHIFVANAKGQEWPPKPLLMVGTEQTASKEPSLKIPAIKAVKALARKALVDELPTIIRLCYTAKFKSSGTFAYSIAEVKPYTIAPSFLKTCLEWVSTRLHLASAHDQASMFGVQGDMSRQKLIFDSWYKYSYSKSRDSHTYPECYVKLCKNICARIGKIKFTPVNSDEFNQDELIVADGFISSLGLSNQFNNLKKKDFQTKLYAQLLSYVPSVYNSLAHLVSSDSQVYFSEIARGIDGLITTLASYLPGLGIDKSLVFIDIYEAMKGHTHYTVHNFKEVVHVLERTGNICNDRIINAIYRFISISSLLDRDHSRKFIALPIEKVLITESELSKLRSVTSEKEEDNLIFSQEALHFMQQHKPLEYERFVRMQDKKQQGATGYVQKGVMSITSSLKRKEDFTLHGEGESHFKLAANKLDEMANIYAELAKPVFDERDKAARKLVAEKKLREKHGIHQAIPMGSPSMQTNSFLTTSVSPSQVYGNSMFVQEQQNTVPIFQTHHQQPVQQVAPHTSMFGAQPVQQSSPLPSVGGGLFGVQPVQQLSPSPVVQQSSMFGAQPVHHQHEVTAAPAGLFGVQPVHQQHEVTAAPAGLFAAQPVHHQHDTHVASPVSGLFGSLPVATEQQPVVSPSGLFGAQPVQQSSPLSSVGAGLFGVQGSPTQVPNSEGSLFENQSSPKSL